MVAPRETQRRHRSPSPAPTAPMPILVQQPSSPRLSRHLIRDTEHSEEGHRIRTSPTPWWHAGVVLLVALLVHASFGCPAFCCVLLTLAFRLGPLNELLLKLPEVSSLQDFQNRQYRVNQSLWLVSLCSVIYSILPEEKKTAQMVGWKMNLVTMETSIASGIAATYGYSVAGGIPGGLVAEYVMSVLGKATVAELSPLVGPSFSKTAVPTGLIMLLGNVMHVCAISAYAFAHRRPPALPPSEANPDSQWCGESMLAPSQPDSQIRHMADAISAVAASRPSRRSRKGKIS